MIKIYIKRPIELLVPVSFIPCHTDAPSLSTSELKIINKKK